MWRRFETRDGQAVDVYWGAYDTEWWYVEAVARTTDGDFVGRVHTTYNDTTAYVVGAL